MYFVRNTFCNTLRRLNRNRMEFVRTKGIKTGTLVIGIGNEFRGDDAAGIIVARKLRAVAPGSIGVDESAGDGTELMDRWSATDSLVLVDATVSSRQAGFIRRIDLTRTELKRDLLPLSSHSFGVTEAIALSRTIGTFPSRAIFYGIEGENFDYGRQMHSGVLNAIEEVWKTIVNEISSLPETVRCVRTTEDAGSYLKDSRSIESRNACSTSSRLSPARGR